jgi:cysteine desulfurase/selenocysteine lyase
VSASLPVSAKLFPGLAPRSLGAKRIYLDHACSTPVPQSVATAVAEYYQRPPGCPLRNSTGASGELELRIRDGRDRLRSWINARFSDEIIFTANTTMAINLIAGAFSRLPGAVLLSDLEHNSNRLPWLEQEIAELPWRPGTEFPMDEFRTLLEQQPIKLVSLTGMSNVTGMALPIGDVVRVAHALGVPVHIDAAQLAMHGRIDVGTDQPDLLSFSLHKAYGPSGLGVLYARRSMQEGLQPRLAGGGSVDDHHDRETVPAQGSARFEFGLQNYAAQYAVPETVEFLRQFEPAAIDAHFEKLGTLARQLLREIPGLRFVGCGKASHGSSIVNYFIEGKDSMRLAELLDLAGCVQIRAGRLCAHHYYHRYDLPPSMRVSFGYHNTEAEVTQYVRSLQSLVQRYV